MPTLAAPGDLPIALNAPGGTIPTDTATRALRSATASIIGEIGWDPFLSTRVYLITEPARTVFLPAAYVSAVSVLVDGLPYTTFMWTERGVVRFNSLITAGTITYTAGWPEASIPDGLREVAVDLAISKLDNPRNLRTWSLGDESETYMGSTAQNPLASDPRLTPFRLPSAVA